MFKEPSTKRAIAFFDGQNLFHNAKHNFGYSFPNYDVHKLASMICSNEGWNLEEVRFYTGVHSPRENKFWNTF